MAGIVAEATQHGLSPAQILIVIPLLIPSTLPYTIPATTLFAACVVYGRLSADNEILAIKTSGVNVLHVVKPGLILGVAMSRGTLGLYFQIIPATHRMLREMAFNNAEDFLYTLLRRDQAINSPQLPYAIFVKGLQGKKMINPVLKKKGEGAAKLDEKNRARLRQQALTWLRADLTAWTQLLAKEPEKARADVHKTLRHWQQDADFAGVRGDRLAGLPKDERQPWQQLWADVEQTLKKAGNSATQDKTKASSKYGSTGRYELVR